MRYTISARGKNPQNSVLGFLARNFASIPLEQIDSLFGFVEYTPLYGGRIYGQPEFSPHDVHALYGAGIGVRLPLTNHYVDEAEYEQSRALLEKYHRPGNAVIVTDDNLARWIRRDFPHYRIEASVIKNLRNSARIEEAMKLYDTVVLPMELNEDEAARDPVRERWLRADVPLAHLLRVDLENQQRQWWSVQVFPESKRTRATRDGGL